jgi:O-antigen ligase
MELSGETETRHFGARAVTLLTIYVALLMYIPSALVVSPLGGAGSPATMLAAGLMAWYLLLWLHPAADLDRGYQPIRAAALLFTGVFIAAYVSANMHVLPTLEQNGADRGLILAFGWLGVLVLAADGITGWDGLEALLRRVVIGGTTMAAIGIAQFLTGVNIDSYISIPGLITKVPFVDLLNRDGINRPSATAAHPLEFAAVLAICLPIALHQARFAAPGTRFRRWSQVALIGAALPTTVSRAAVLGIAVVAVLLLPTWPARERRAACAIIAAGGVGLWLAIPQMVTLLFQLFTRIGYESSSQSRIQAYSASVPFIAHHPWLGRGFGTFLPQTYFFTDNQYLSQLIETGFAGLLGLLLMLAAGWTLARRGRRRLTDARRRDLLQSLAVAVAATAVSFATFDALSFEIATGLTFLILGCCGAAWRLALADGGVTRPRLRQVAPAPGQPPGVRGGR